MGDATGIEAKEFIMLLPLGHSLKPTPKFLGESNARAAWASRV